MASTAILITGSTGFIGSHIAMALSRKAEWNVILDHVGPNRAIDLATPGEILRLIAKNRPNVVVHTAAISSIAACEDNQELATRVNVDAVREITDACGEIGSRLIHLSTDQVFDGTQAPYSEQSAPCPLHYYGETKVMAEEIIERHLQNAVILRPTLVYGNAPNHERSASEAIRVAAQAGQSLGLFQDEYRVPLYVEDLVYCVEQLATQSTKGIFHVGGPERLSRYEFGQLICQALELDHAAISPSSLQVCNLIGKRPADLTLDTSKLAATIPWAPKGTLTALSR